MRTLATRPVVRRAAIGATVVNLDIHAAQALGHGREMPYIGILFVIAAALLGAIIIGLCSGRDSRRASAWIGGCIVSGGEFVLFVLSRTIGLPSGNRDAWATTPEDQLRRLSLPPAAAFNASATISLTHRPEAHVSGHRHRLGWHDRTAPLP